LRRMYSSSCGSGPCIRRLPGGLGSCHVAANCQGDGFAAQQCALALYVTRCVKFSNRRSGRACGEDSCDWKPDI
jgi:hypothetical protein